MFLLSILTFLRGLGLSLERHRCFILWKTVVLHGNTELFLKFAQNIKANQNIWFIFLALKNLENFNSGLVLGFFFIGRLMYFSRKYQNARCHWEKVILEMFFIVFLCHWFLFHRNCFTSCEFVTYRFCYSFKISLLYLGFDWKVSTAFNILWSFKNWKRWCC